jgi:DMSO reductase anchor subunit
MTTASGIAASAIAATGLWKYITLARSSEFESRQSARLLRRTLRKQVAWRFALLTLACFPALPGPAALVLALAGEVLGRYLFFVSVVPRNMAATFFSGREAA